MHTKLEQHVEIMKQMSTALLNMKIRRDGLKIEIIATKKRKLTKHK